MFKTKTSESHRLRRVLVEYRGEEHPFLVTHSLTFEQLLEEAARHFNVDATEFELQDDSYCTVPLTANVREEFEEMLKGDCGDEDMPLPVVEVRLHLRQTKSYHPRYHSSPHSSPAFNSLPSFTHTTQSLETLPSPRPSSLCSAFFLSPFSSKALHSSLENVTTLPPRQMTVTKLDNVDVTNSPSSNDNGMKKELSETREVESSQKSSHAASVAESAVASSSLTATSGPHCSSQPSSDSSLSQQQQQQSTTSSPPASDASRGSRIKICRQDALCVTEIHYSDIRIVPTTGLTVVLKWESPPTLVLIVKKRDDPHVTECFKKVAEWLLVKKKVAVMVESHVVEEVPELQLLPFTPEELKKRGSKLDFVISMGGDGTVLHVNSLFQQCTPPIISINLGSLGFLSPFKFANFKKTITTILQSESLLTLRTRLHCKIMRRRPDEQTPDFVKEYTVLNEVVVDRGPSPYLCNLECYCDDHKVTNIQADGIIISTATGSTAYSLAAGGSIVHPQVPGILFTPICPHSLSFRPLIFPDSVELRIQLAKESRATAWASFDGRARTEMTFADFLLVRISEWPFVCINSVDTVGDWFRGLADCLHWNDRQKQKTFDRCQLFNGE